MQTTVCPVLNTSASKSSAEMQLPFNMQKCI